jgi:hypothetical protein
MIEVNGRADTSRSRRSSWTIGILLVLVVVLAGVLLVMAHENRKEASRVGAPTTPTGSSSSSITSRRNDAMTDYEAALQTGKPIYVLFHSLT